jgi:hypothetical protein
MSSSKLACFPSRDGFLKGGYFFQTSFRGLCSFLKLLALETLGIK